MLVFKQPDHISNVLDYARVSAVGPKGIPHVTLWGDKYPLVPTNDLVKNYLVGFKAKSQVSTRTWWPGSTGIQVAGDTIGINIEAWSNWANLQERRLGTIVIGCNFTEIPVKNKVFTYSFGMAVPSLKTFNKGVGQVVAYYSFTDKKNKKSFWLGTNLVDSREKHRYLDSVSLDAGTNSYMVNTASSQFVSSNFSDFRHYEVRVSNERLLVAINKLNAKGQTFSLNVEDYVLRHINLNPEIHVPSWTSYAQIGIKVKNWQLEYTE